MENEFKGFLCIKVEDGCVRPRPSIYLVTHTRDCSIFFSCVSGGKLSRLSLVGQRDLRRKSRIEKAFEGNFLAEGHEMENWVLAPDLKRKIRIRYCCRIDRYCCLLSKWGNGIYSVASIIIIMTPRRDFSQILDLYILPFTNFPNFQQRSMPRVYATCVIEFPPSLEILSTCCRPPSNSFG